MTVLGRDDVSVGFRCGSVRRHAGAKCPERDVSSCSDVVLIQ